MAWVDSTFNQGFNSWLISLSANSAKATADIIASLYESSSRTASPLAPSFSSVSLALNNKKIISDGFLNSFNLARKMKVGEPNSGLWLPAASSIVLYWTNVKFSLSPPPPGGLVGASNSVTFPGDPNKLAEEISFAFKSRSAERTTNNLIRAFKNHLLTVTGLWNGTAPGAPPPPVSIPWAGLI